MLHCIPSLLPPPVPRVSPLLHCILAKDIAAWREDGTTANIVNQHLSSLRDKGLAEWTMVETEKPNGLIARLRTGLRIVEVTTRQGENKLAQSADSAALDEIRKQLGGA